MEVLRSLAVRGAWRALGLWPSPEDVAEDAAARAGKARVLAPLVGSVALLTPLVVREVAPLAGLAFGAALLFPASHARGRARIRTAYAAVAAGLALGLASLHANLLDVVGAIGLTALACAMAIVASRRSGESDPVGGRVPRRIERVAAGLGGLAVACVGVLAYRWLRGVPVLREHVAWAAGAVLGVGVAFAVRRAHEAALARLGRPDLWERRWRGVHVPLDERPGTYRANRPGMDVDATKAELEAAREDVRLTRSLAALAAVALSAVPVALAVLQGPHRLDTPSNLRLRLREDGLHGAGSAYEASVDGEGRVRFLGYARIEPLGLSEWKVDPARVRSLWLMAAQRGFLRGAPVSSGAGAEIELRAGSAIRRASPLRSGVAGDELFRGARELLAIADRTTDGEPRLAEIDTTAVALRKTPCARLSAPTASEPDPPPDETCLLPVRVRAVPVVAKGLVPTVVAAVAAEGDARVVLHCVSRHGPSLRGAFVARPFDEEAVRELHSEDPRVLHLSSCSVFDAPPVVFPPATPSGGRGDEEGG